MTDRMFCFQCEQTAGCSACTGAAGVCGKTARVADLQDQLTGALIALAQSYRGRIPAQEACATMSDGLFSTVTNVDFSEASILSCIDRVHAEKVIAAKDAPVDYVMEDIWGDDEDIRSLKSLVLFGIRGMAAYAYHARVLGYVDEAVDAFIFEALSTMATERDGDVLLPLALKVGEVNLACMALLDRANTETYGNPVPTTVSLTVESGPFIIVTGHDLHDLSLLLEQSADRGVDIYTHGEMLPAQAYPELAKYPHLKGNLGTAWQNQQHDFDDIPAPILFTTNCLMPPKSSYIDRVFTTGVVDYDGAVHIGADKDFAPLITRALELGGYHEDQVLVGINGGAQVTTGFGRDTILSAAGDVVAAVKAGGIKHFFLVGGCDGARIGRNYFTEFVEGTPDDTIILTLGCAKYRFNDLDLGTIGSLPRLLDMGQCNDAYGAIQVALVLAEALDCGVNDLPLSLVISWYEQKAVCVLLTLLSLDIKNIYLGPTLPAFLSQNVLDRLVEDYGVTPVDTPQADLKALLA
jgi:hydroxylamine reductase